MTAACPADGTGGGAAPLLPMHLPENVIGPCFGREYRPALADQTAWAHDIALESYEAEPAGREGCAP